MIFGTLWELYPGRIPHRVHHGSTKEKSSFQLLIFSVAVIWKLSIFDTFFNASITYYLILLSLQIFLVSILFYSPPAEGMKIERSLDFGKSYQPWQYFSTNCSKSFNMPDNGLLPNPDSVNCIHVPRYL